MKFNSQGFIGTWHFETRDLEDDYICGKFRDYIFSGFRGLLSEQNEKVNRVPDGVTDAD